MGEKMRKSNLTNIDPKKARVSREESRPPTPSYIPVWRLVVMMIGGRVVVVKSILCSITLWLFNIAMENHHF